MNIFDKYLNEIQEQQMGVPPKPPVKKPQPKRPTSPNQIAPKVPQPKVNPVAPQVTKQKQVPDKNMNPDQQKQQAQNVQTQQAPINKNVPPQKPVQPPKEVPVNKPVPKPVDKSQQKPQPQPQDEQPKKAAPKAYFNYMAWSSKILKQGEIFRKQCYTNNCDQHAAGTGDRRICKDRCDIETCKKVIALLKASQGKCATTNDPKKCKERYMYLIPLYQEKLNKISAKYIEAQKRKKKAEFDVG